MSNAADIQSLSLNREEAYYYWFHVVKAFFALVTNGSATKAPTEAVFFPVADLFNKFPHIVFYGDNVRHWQPQSDFHAIRIILNDDQILPNHPQRTRIRFEVALLNPRKIEGWSDGILFGRDATWPVPLTWQYSVWEKCLCSHPASHRMLDELHRFQQGKKVPTRTVLQQKETAALWLFLAMMDRYWRAQNYNYKLRAHAVESAGVPGKHSPNSVKIQASKIGLRRAIGNELLRQVNSLKRQSRKFFAAHKAEKLYVETLDFPIPAFPIPDAIDDILADGHEATYDDDYRVKRMLYMRNRMQ